MGFPIRKSPDQSLLAAPRGLSQLATSFIAVLLPRHPPCALSSLTTKFTRRTASFEPQLRAVSRANSTVSPPSKLYSATLLLARLGVFSCSANCRSLASLGMTIWVKVSLIEEALRTPAGTIGTHKNLLRLVFAQSIQLSNIVLAEASSLDDPPGPRLTTFILPRLRVWVLLNPECANP